VKSTLQEELLESLEKKLEELREASENGIELITLNRRVLEALVAALLNRYEQEQEELKNNKKRTASEKC